MEMVAKIFLFTVKAVRSKCGFSSVPSNDQAIVFASAGVTIFQLEF